MSPLLIQHYYTKRDDFGTAYHGCPVFQDEGANSIHLTDGTYIYIDPALECSTRKQCLAINDRDVGPPF